MTELLCKVVTQSRHPLTSLVWSQYRPKLKQNNLKCPVNIFPCQRLVGVVTVKMTVVDQENLCAEENLYLHGYT